MKKFFLIAFSILLIIPTLKPVANENLENDSEYNYILEDGTSLGKDNLGENSKEKSLPKMIDGDTETINNIVVLIRFKGEEDFIDESNFKVLLNSYNLYTDSDLDNVADIGSISLNSYINDLTYGKVNINSTFYPTNTDGFFSIEAPETREYYEQFIAGSSEEDAFIEWAFEAVKDEIKLTGNELDKDNDGEIDIVTFLCSGATTKSNMLWPHETRYSGDTSLNGKALRSYNIINIGTESNNLFNKGNLKIAIHEFLHAFSYPDLYRYHNDGNPVGYWDIMAESSGYGQLPLVYTRNTYSNLNLNIQEVYSDGVYRIKSSQNNNTNEVMAVKIKSPLSDTEYFMAEFRKKEGNWDSALPGSGLILYRINNDVDPFDGNRSGSPDHIYVFRPDEINNISASGNTSISFLSEESGRTSFGSNKLNNEFISDSLFFSNGQNSGIVISEVSSASGDEISFKVTYPKEEKEINVSKIVGKDRYDTAAILSRTEFKSSETVLIVNGLAIADGIGATPLATILKSPILLTRSNTIPKETKNEIIRLNSKRAIIIGGNGVIDKNVEKELRNLGVLQIERLGGKDRYATSLEIAKYIDSNLYNIENIVISNGLGEADAMSIASVAGRDNMPIILSKTNSIDSEVYNWLKDNKLKNAYIVGGTGVVSNKVLNGINLITSQDISKNRLGGKDRYDTNALVIEKFYDENLNGVYVTKGIELVDALTAGPIAGVNSSPIVLTKYDLNKTQKNILEPKFSNYIVQTGGGVSVESIDSLKKLLQ